MTYAQPASAILRLAGPTIAGNFAASLAAIIALRAAGTLGEAQLAGMLAADRVQAFMLCTFSALSAGVVALVAQSWGAGDRGGAERAVGAARDLSLVVSVLLTCLTWLLAPYLLQKMGVAPSAIATTVGYLRTLAFFNVAYGLIQVLTNALRACGDAGTPMMSAALGAFINALAVTALVRGYGPLPALGLKGAALGAGAAFVVSATFLSMRWRYGRSGISRGDQTSVREGWHQARKILAIGLPATGQHILFQGGLSLMMFLVGRYGPQAVAGYGVGVSLMTLAYVFGTGFGVASATLVGQAIGAGKPGEAGKVVWRVAVWAVCCMGALGLLAWLSADYIAVAMNLGPEASLILSTFLLCVMFAMPLMALEFAFQGALRGAGDNRAAMFITLTGLGVRAVFALAFHFMGLGLTWILGALVLDYTVKAVLYTQRIRKGAWARRII
jgi:putative MATE family efflux protein